MITADLQDAFYAFAKDESCPEVRRARAQNMGESLGVFMQGFLGELFNRPGQNWPEADVTLIDLVHWLVKAMKRRWRWPIPHWLIPSTISPNATNF
jgi:hypothetical protein